MNHLWYRRFFVYSCRGGLLVLTGGCLLASVAQAETPMQELNRSFARVWHRGVRAVLGKPVMPEGVLADEEGILAHPPAPLPPGTVVVPTEETEIRFADPVDFWWHQNPSMEGKWDYFRPVGDVRQPIKVIVRRRSVVPATPELLARSAASSAAKGAVPAPAAPVALFPPPLTTAPVMMAPMTTAPMTMAPMTMAPMTMAPMTTAPTMAAPAAAMAPAPPAATPEVGVPPRTFPSWSGQTTDGAMAPGSVL
ncbi:MAG: hypothetical protein HQL57_06025 [Magnetococcales bacterium]|nr:hypothetical protein [Magnetococcales bacterium]MBF0156725.1 hypothetical protein [Magnetococcales bacterium]